MHRTHSVHQVLLSCFSLSLTIEVGVEVEAQGGSQSIMHVSKFWPNRMTLCELCLESIGSAPPTHSSPLSGWLVGGIDTLESKVVACNIICRALRCWIVSKRRGVSTVALYKGQCLKVSVPSKVWRSGRFMLLAATLSNPMWWAGLFLCMVADAVKVAS